MINDTTTRVIYTGDGVTKEFPFGFQITNKNSIRVVIADTDGNETELKKDYFVDENKKTVFYPGYAPGEEPDQSDIPPLLQEGEKIAIIRETPINQLATFGRKWPFYIGEIGLDKLTMIAQEIRQLMERTILLGETNENTNLVIPRGEPNTVIGWDASGKKLVNVAELLNPLISSMNIYKNIKAMKADGVLFAGKMCTTNGFYTESDGGGAVYQIRNKKENDVIDDGLLHELNTGLVAELIITNDTVNVKQFGAVGDGINDDYKAIYNCIRSKCAKKIIFPAGKYAVSRGVYIKEADNIKIEGIKATLTFIDNADVLQKMYDPNYNYGLMYGQLLKIEGNNNEVAGMTFDGNCENIYFIHEGKKYYGYVPAESVKVDGIPEKYIVTSGLSMTGDNIHVLNCNFVKIGFPLKINDLLYEETIHTNALLENLTFEQFFRDGIVAINTSYLTIKDCYFKNGQRKAIQLYNRDRHCVIENVNVINDKDEIFHWYPHWKWENGDANLMGIGVQNPNWYDLSGDIRIVNCSIKTCKQCIAINNPGNDIRVLNCTLKSKTANAVEGYLQNGEISNCTIKANKCSVHVKYKDFSQNYSSGDLENRLNVIISQNKILKYDTNDNRAAIKVEEESRITAESVCLFIANNLVDVNKPVLEKNLLSEDKFLFTMNPEIIEDISGSINHTETPTISAFKKNGKMLFLQYLGGAKKHTAGDILFKIDKKYAPMENISIPFVYNNGKGMGSVYIFSSGTCKIDAISNTTDAGRVVLTTSYTII